MGHPGAQRQLLDVDAGDAGGEAAENFVDDGSGDAGVVVGSDGAVGAAADEQGFVADGGIGDIGDVDHGEIHADVAGDGGVMVAQNDLATVGKMAAEAVSVADGDNGEAGGASGLPALVVADGGAGGYVAEGDDAGLPGEDGSKRQGGFAA